ncbi:MAG: hypothetical protein GX298_01785 [Planctomycetes bacterium]|nr:hypothetical protein [Planctomycetota bacterium]
MKRDYGILSARFCRAFLCVVLRHRPNDRDSALTHIPISIDSSPPGCWHFFPCFYKRCGLINGKPLGGPFTVQLNIQ